MDAEERTRMAHQSRIMYIENKGGNASEPWWATTTSPANLTGPGRIGRVTFSKTGRSLTYRGKQFSKANDFKANYLCETGEWFWISGPKRRGGDALYPTNIPAQIDEDVREEYWTEIRKQPERKNETSTK
jgi:hypothetical protein